MKRKNFYGITTGPYGKPIEEEIKQQDKENKMFNQAINNWKPNLESVLMPFENIKGGSRDFSKQPHKFKSYKEIESEAFNRGFARGFECVNVKLKQQYKNLRKYYTKIHLSDILIAIAGGLILGLLFILP